MFKNRFLTIFVCIFTAVVLIFGGVLGIIIAVRNSQAVVVLGRVKVDEGALRYLSATYKVEYIRTLLSAGVKASDSESFWNSTDASGKTQGEIYNESFEEYVRAIASACSIFLSYSSYTQEDKESVKATVAEVLKYKADGSKEKFNELTAEYGFDYDDFCSAAELLYKADKAKTVIYGEDGENLSNFPAECEKYLETYTHVSLIFVRDKEVFVVDEEGNYVYDENGNVTTREMTEEEKAERQEVIGNLTAAIEARENGGDGQITPEMFEIYLEKSNGDPDMYKKGYYFNKNASATEEFSSAFPEVVERAFEMEIGEYARVDCSIGVCFIYRYDVTSGAYSDTEDLFFSDFYSDASDYLYDDVLKTYSPNVNVKDSFYETDYSQIPLLTRFIIAEWK